MKAKPSINNVGREPKRVFGAAARKETLLDGCKQRLLQARDLNDVAIRSEALGVHLVVEMRDCLTERLDDIKWVKRVMIVAALRAKATIVQTVFHKFNPVGISGVVVIAESHLAIHIWPEYRYAAVDIFSCGKKLRAAAAAQFLIKQFRSCRPAIIEMQRGLTPMQKTPVLRSVSSRIYPAA